MAEKKLFSDRRWNDIPKANVIGTVEFTEEEKKQIREKTINYFISQGIVKDEEEFYQKFTEV